MLKSIIAIFLITAATLIASQEVFRENFRTIKAHVPLVTEDLTMSPFLSLVRHGETGDQYKLSFHPERTSDPHYIWNGLTSSSTAVEFTFAQPLDMSAVDTTVKCHTKNEGTSLLHLALKTPQGWIVTRKGIAKSKNWKTDQFQLHKTEWLKFDNQKIHLGSPIKKPFLKQIEALAFVNPKAPNKSKDCTRIDWFSLHSSSAKISPNHQVKSAPFWEKSQPFLRSALVFKEGKKENRTRRGIILRLGHGLYTCFDPDLLRYSALWRANEGEIPITMDSMAGTSYPDKHTKATRPPELQGALLASTPEIAGVAQENEAFTDPRTQVSNSSGDKLGRLPRKFGRWLGLTVKDLNTTLQYQVGKTKLQESILALDPNSIERTIHIGPTDKTIHIAIAQQNTHLIDVSTTALPEISAQKNYLIIKPFNKDRTIKILIKLKPSLNANNDSDKAIADPLAKSMEISSLKAAKRMPIKVRNLVVPHDNIAKRPVRLTSIDFLSSGDAIISTLDGDIWRVEDIDQKTARWTRVAAGIFEPMSVAINTQDQVFVLGRDQVTELVDTDADGIYDVYKCASDAFFQTLHTRDFSTSLLVDKSGDFIISKGGIRPNSKGRSKDENSLHRGAIVRLPADGGEATVMGDGLRIPFLGMHSNGQLYISDQQGHFTPSTPIYKVDPSVPSFGFDPTNHRKIKQSEPILWFPYSSNRSAAAFSMLPTKSFPDFPSQIANLSWNGRLFAINDKKGQVPFALRLPIQLDFPILDAAVHPKNGRLYGVGLGISGYKTDTKLSAGLCEITQSSPIPNPQSIEVGKNTITFQFSKPLSSGFSFDFEKTSIKAWNIKKSSKYGSGHFRWDNRAGEHTIRFNANFSSDRKQLIFKTSDVFQSSILSLNIPVKNNKNTFPLEISMRLDHLKKPNKSELAALKKEQVEGKLVKGNAKRGKKAFQKYACATCHSLKSQKLNGPPLNGIAKRHNANYIRESILEPQKIITKGYEAGMPSFKGVMKSQELVDIVSYILSLK